jgi:tRNA nucleotidyltransferase/poly(A) polymerase
VQKVSSFLSKEIQELIDLKQGGQKLYLVGGVIRDFCIDRQNRDVDVLCDSDTRLIARRFADLNRGVFFVMDVERNTSRVIIVKEGVKKIYDFARLKGDDLEEDLFARDFTINAMAVDLDQPDTIIDPTGGQQDLRDGRLRECSPESFSSDPVRIIRAVRYSLGYGLEIEPITLQHLKEYIPLLDKVSGERKRDEIFKILESTKPDKGFSMLVELGILKQMDFPPVVHNEQIEKRISLTYRFLTELYSTEAAREGAAENSFVPFREDTRRKLTDHLRRKNSSDRNEHQLILLASILYKLNAPDVEKVAARLLLSREERDNLLLITTNPKLDALLGSKKMPDDRGLYQYYRSTGESGVDLAIMLLVNSSLGGDPASEQFSRDLCQRVISFWFERPEVANPVLLLNGKDLMVNFDLTPGPLIGELIEKLREEQAAGGVKDRKEALVWVETELAKHRIGHPWED